MERLSNLLMILPVTLYRKWLRSAAASSAAALVLVFALAVPFHLIEEHHRAGAGEVLHWHADDHGHHHHAVDDHDYDGVRSQHAPLFVIVSDDFSHFPLPDSRSYLRFVEDDRLSPHDGSGSASLRAPPAA